MARTDPSWRLGRRPRMRQVAMTNDAVDPLAALLAGLTSARALDLGRPLENGMAQSAAAVAYEHDHTRLHGDHRRPDGGSSASDLLTMGTHVGTHIDALAHYSHDGQLHGPADAASEQAAGFPRHGIHVVGPILARGLLLDVAGALGISACPPAYEITVGDLDRALEPIGESPAPGDVLFVRTGWGQMRLPDGSHPGARQGVPGVGEDGARWLTEHRPRAVGADTGGFERLPPDADLQTPLPAHRVLLFESGINIIENVELDVLADEHILQFGLIAVPLKLIGATGSPIRPIALLPRATD